MTELQKTVLLVDDNDEVRDTLNDFLVEYEYNVLPAASSKAAIEIIKQYQGDIGYAVIDLILEGNDVRDDDGIDVFFKLVRKYPAAKKVIYTGHDLDDAKKQINKLAQNGAITIVQQREIERNLLWKGDIYELGQGILEKFKSLSRWWGGDYYALLIAVQDYEHHPYPKNLLFPKTDVETLQRVLTEHYVFESGNIESLLNPSRQDIVRKLFELSEKLTENDSLLIFYAGHGQKDGKNGKGYWMARDFNSHKPETWLSHADVRDWIARIPSKHVLLVSDSCFSGTFCELRTTKETPTLSCREQYELPCRIVVSSGNQHETVLDDSVFLRLILDYLTNNTEPLFGVQTMFEAIQPSISTEAEKLRPEGQHPLCKGLADAGKHDKKADFIFIRR